MTRSEPSISPEFGLSEHMNPLLRYAKRLTRNPETAQDLVQETLVQALRHKERIAHADHPARYLAIMLRNLNASRHRRYRGEMLPLEEDKLDLPANEAPAPATQTCREVMEAVLSLQPEHSQILILSAYEGLSYRELAERLDIPLGTVMSRLHRARAALRRAIDLEEHEMICDIFAA